MSGSLYCDGLREISWAVDIASHSERGTVGQNLQWKNAQEWCEPARCTRDGNGDIRLDRNGVSFGVDKGNTGAPRTTFLEVRERFVANLVFRRNHDDGTPFLQ